MKTPQNKSPKKPKVSLWEWAENLTDEERLKLLEAFLREGKLRVQTEPPLKTQLGLPLV
jgi:hypothetical protein